MDFEDKTTNKNLPPTKQSKTETALQQSLIKMGQEMTERGKEFDKLKKELTIKMPENIIETFQKFQQTIAETSKRIAPMTDILSKVAKQWSTQQDILAPALRQLAGPIEKVREAVNRYHEMQKDMKIYLQEPPQFLIRPKQEDITATEIEEIKGLLQELLAKNKNKKEYENPESKKSGKYLIFYTKDNIELKLNKENGDVKLGEIEGNLAPGTQEYKIFLHLLESSSHISNYVALLKLLHPNQNFDKPLKAYQVQVWALNSVIRNIKTRLGILPIKRAVNKDIFRTLKQQKAYSLSLKE